VCNTVDSCSIDARELSQNLALMYCHEDFPCTTLCQTLCQQVDKSEAEAPNDVAMPSKRPTAGPSDPRLALAKALLYFKLKAASLIANGPSKASRDCIKAAGDVEGCMVPLEAGSSMLQLARSQVGNNIVDVAISSEGFNATPLSMLALQT
jgi:hypothetical protein